MILGDCATASGKFAWKRLISKTDRSVPNRLPSPTLICHVEERLIETAQLSLMYSNVLLDTGNMYFSLG